MNSHLSALLGPLGKEAGGGFCTASLPGLEKRRLMTGLCLPQEGQENE